jgi:hypothetical protein
MKFYTVADIEKYLKLHPSFTGSTEELTSLVNFFAEGPVINLSNFLYKQIAEDCNELQHGLQRGCRCGSCCEWQIVTPSATGDREIIASTECMTEWAVDNVYRSRT